VNRTGKKPRNSSLFKHNPRELRKKRVDWVGGESWAEKSEKGLPNVLSTPAIKTGARKEKKDIGDPFGFLESIKKNGEGKIDQ